MNAALGAALLALAIAVPAAGGDTDEALPPDVLRAIATLAPTTVPVGRVDVSAEDCALDRPDHPARVRGDFDGDGLEDWALHLRSPRPTGTRVAGGHTWTMYAHRFVVLRGLPNGAFEPVTITLGEQALPFALMLERQPSGLVKEVDGGEDRRVQLRHPGIIEIYCGKAASTYYWDPRTRRFDFIVTGD